MCDAYFLMLSAGIPIIQNANEAKPPERKFAVGVLIYGEAVVGVRQRCRYVEENISVRTSYFVPCSLENPRMNTLAGASKRSVC